MDIYKSGESNISAYKQGLPGWFSGVGIGEKEDFEFVALESEQCVGKKL